MAPRWFILNEWILHDLVGENGIARQKQSGEFLATLLKTSDGIVVCLESQWMRKFWGFYNQNSQRDGYRTEVRRLLTLLYRDFIRQNQKCLGLLNDQVGEIPATLQGLLDSNTIDRDDTYLFQAYYAPDVQADCIITTDQRLIDALARHYPEIKTRHRDDFLNEYLGTSPAQLP